MSIKCIKNVFTWSFQRLFSAKTLHHRGNDQQTWPCMCENKDAWIFNYLVVFQYRTKLEAIG